MKRAAGSRKTATLSKSIHHQLNAYAIAAGAAGVGMLALAQSAQAKIVYTKANIPIPSRTTIFIDLNHDGKKDFGLWRGDGHVTSLPSSFMAIYPNPSYGNAAIGTAQGWFKSAVPLRAGHRVGPHRVFNGNPGQMVRRLVKHATTNPVTYWYGPWANGGKGLRDRYLGLKFTINGKSHYGWARVSVTIGQQNFTATLTGYAFETIASKPIVAGQTKGPDDVVERPDAALTAPTPEPATLGMLALGERGLSIWRREERE
ncbi:MAG TPA: hypothetical protein VNZ03_36340 [Terriglobales bacterium]|jgi:hypothetical protein|nr:hypothetical protein [Terriglobales bacterium]